MDFYLARLAETEAGLDGDARPPEQRRAQIATQRRLLNIVEDVDSDGLERHLRLMALAYQAHPHYRREWAPGGLGAPSATADATQLDLGSL